MIPYNIKPDADREKSGVSEYVNIFSIAFQNFEIFYFKMNRFLSIFADFLLIFGMSDEPGFSRCSSNDSLSCQLIHSIRI